MLDNHVDIVIVLSVALTSFLLGACAWVLILHYQNERARKYRSGLYDKWRPYLLDYIAGGSIPDLFRSAARGEPGYFTGFLSHHVNLLSGAARDRLKSLLDMTELRAYTLGGLRSRHRWIAARAAGMIALFQKEGYEEQLTALLRHKSASVAFAAANALAHTAPAGILGRILESLARFEHVNQDLAAIVLLSYGKRHPDALAQYVEQNDLSGYRLYPVLLEVLGEVCGLGAAPLLRRELQSPHSLESGLKALRAIGEIKDTSACDLVISLAQDAAWEVRAIVAWTLGRLADPRAIPHLQKLLEDSSWNVRLNAATALAGMEEIGVRALVQSSEYSPDAYAGDMARHVLELHELGVPAR